MEVSTKKNVVLVSWRFQFKFGVTGSVFKNFAFIVEGSRADDGREWASSEVMDVEPPFRIHTQNTIYDLRGPIDKEKCVGRKFLTFLSIFLIFRKKKIFILPFKLMRIRTSQVNASNSFVKH